MEPFKKGDQLEVEILESNAFAVGIAKINELTLEVPKTLPGERVKVRLEKEFQQGKLWLCSVVQLIKPSSIRECPQCADSVACNGCALDFLPYEQQLEWKNQRIQTIFPKALKTIASPKVSAYRNTARFTAGMRQGRFVLGAFSKTQDELISLSRCQTCPEIFSQVNESVVEILNQNLGENQSFLNALAEISYRYSFSENTVMMIFQMREAVSLPQGFLEELMLRHPEAVSFYQSLSHKKSGHLSRTAFHHVKGEKFLIETLEETQIKFRIFPDSLIYPNLFQGQRIYQYLINKAALSGRDKAVDLSCGSGISSLHLGKKARLVYGMEMDRFFIRDAVFNSRLNRMENVIFMAKEMEEFSKMKDILSDEISVVSVKPPSKGIPASLLETFSSQNFQKIFYTTPHAETLKQDLEKMDQAGYVLVEIQPFDILPQTFHLELVAVFKKKKKIKIKVAKTN